MRREKLTIAFASVIEALFLLLEIYFMIHEKGNFPILLIVAICMVAVLFFLVLSIIELVQKNKEADRLSYADIYKAQKASYLAQKKAFDELNVRLSQLEENTNFPAEDIITAQKAVAKVTISRSKENAEALMNANDELIQKVFSFEEKLEGNNESLLRQQETMLQQTREELLSNNQGMQDQFDALQQALDQMKQEISELELKQPVIQQVVAPSAPAASVEAQPEEVPVAVETPVATAEVPVEEVPVAPVDVPVEEAPAATAEVPVIPDLPVADPNAEFSQDDIDSLLASLGDPAPAAASEESLPNMDAIDLPELGDEDLPKLDDIDLPELGDEDLPKLDDIDLPELGDEDLPKLDDIDLPELGGDDLPDLDGIDLPEADGSDVAAAEEVAEPAAAEPSLSIADLDMSDPNKVLSADEIAALFASAGN